MTDNRRGHGTRDDLSSPTRSASKEIITYDASEASRLVQYILGRHSQRALHAAIAGVVINRTTVSHGEKNVLTAVSETTSRAAAVVAGAQTSNDGPAARRPWLMHHEQPLRLVC